MRAALKVLGSVLDLKDWFGASPVRRDAELVFAAANEASRRVELYAPGGIDDTLDGRLESLMLHAALVMIRLKAAPGPLAQAFADRLFQALDDGLREDGVGDLTVPKRMKKLAQRFYGRLLAYEAGLDAADPAVLIEAIARNVRPQSPDFSAYLADYARAAHAALAIGGVEALGLDSVWPTPPAQKQARA